MLPTIGMMVAAIGLVFCLYVITRMIALIQTEEISGAADVLAIITIIVAVLGAGWLALLAMSLLSQG